MSNLGGNTNEGGALPSLGILLSLISLQALSDKTDLMRPIHFLEITLSLHSPNRYLTFKAYTELHWKYKLIFSLSILGTVYYACVSKGFRCRSMNKVT